MRRLHGMQLYIDTVGGDISAGAFDGTLQGALETV